jgi:hypothetical protein
VSLGVATLKIHFQLLLSGCRCGSATCSGSFTTRKSKLEVQGRQNCRIRDIHCCRLMFVVQVLAMELGLICRTARAAETHWSSQGLSPSPRFQQTNRRQN